jgi:DNA-binding transcriptional LysR family regulator
MELMDKLRALQYFAVAAEERSLSAAARRLGVSTPAVAKLVTSLERNLGTTLVNRTARGLALTADGERYLENCRPALAQLAAADDLIGASAARPRGAVVVGTTPVFGQHCLLPALAEFHARYPDLQVEIRTVYQLGDAAASTVDVFVLQSWPQGVDLVQRSMAQGRFVVCASPAYWAVHGSPVHPKDLERHPCFLYRTFGGTVLDLWRFERNGHEEAVTVSGWLVTDQRETMLDAAIAGEGVARLLDLTSQAALRSGRLVPVLLDWEAKEAPRFDLLFRPAQRRTPRIRLVIDFITGIFRKLEAEREDGVAQPPSARPRWVGRGYRRTSSAGARGRE